MKIKKAIEKIILILGITTGLSLCATSAIAGAAPSSIFDNTCDGNDSALCEEINNGNTSVFSAIKTIVNALLFILGAVAVIVIIVAGITFATSGGNEQSVKRARDMILYAVVGLVVAICSYAIVNFVLVNLF
jgi:hypothetical protein